MDEKKYVTTRMLFFIIANIIAWGGLSLCDYLEEHDKSTVVADGVAILAFPILVGVANIVFVIMKRNLNVSVKELIFDKLRWVGVSAGFAILISFLALNDMWVYQNTGGWDNFLNGIEYPAMGLFMVVGGLIVFSITDAIVAAVKRI